MARGNGVEQTPVAILPDAGPQSLNGICDGLLEITQIAFQMNRCVKGRATKQHLCIESEDLLIRISADRRAEPHEVLRRVRKRHAIDEPLKKEFGISAQELLEFCSRPGITFLDALRLDVRLNLVAH